MSVVVSGHVKGLLELVTVLPIPSILAADKLEVEEKGSGYFSLIFKAGIISRLVPDQLRSLFGNK